MSDYDNDILLQMQRDGVRTVSGHHMHRETQAGRCPICRLPLTAPSPEVVCRYFGVHPVREREGRHIECLPCGDQGCDFCNEVPDED